MVDLPNATGELLAADEQGDEEFAVYSVRVTSPHWVFVRIFRPTCSLNPLWIPLLQINRTYIEVKTCAKE